MGTSAFDGAGLESAFHDAVTWLSTTDRNGPRFKRPAILEKAAGQVNFQPGVLRIEKYKGKNLLRKACYGFYKCCTAFLWISTWRPVLPRPVPFQNPVRKRCRGCAGGGHKLGATGLFTHRPIIHRVPPRVAHRAHGSLSTGFKVVQPTYGAWHNILICHGPKAVPVWITQAIEATIAAVFAQRF